VPCNRPVLTRVEARRTVSARGFDQPVGGSPATDAHATDGLVGIELEWLVVDADDPGRPVPLDRVEAAARDVGPLPGGSVLTFEPGGQVELSSPPLPLLLACDATANDACRLGDALAEAGIALVGLGLEPGPRRDRAVHSARYDAMEEFFDSIGTAGRTMMRSTAALQVNLDLGRGAEVERRWRAAHDVGPVLAAAFANSPIGDDGPTGHRSTRLAVWAAIDGCRTRPPDLTGDCRDAWADYALSANVMLVRASDECHVPVLAPLSFEEWIDDGHQLGWPTVDDLDYHLTTLFPPVRPRGWLELRMIDAVPAPWWRVAVAVSAVLVQHPRLLAEVAPALEPTVGRWDVAARDGLTDPAFAAAARACFEVAGAALPRAGADDATIAATDAFIDTYVSRGRCPADDRLDAWHAGRSPLPEPDNGRDLERART
jgi:glutamate--cysteine ligase